MREQNKKLPFVITVLLNWNKWEYTAECLRSLQNLDYLNNQTVVVDNGSTNDSVARLRSLFPDVTLITNEENLGFAAGCNVGIRYALNQGADYVWLLNNDTVVHPHALTALVERAESESQVGAAGSVIYDWLRRDRILAWGGGYVNFWLGRSRHFRFPVPDDRLHFLTGASMLIRTEALEAVGLLDERFFLYWEDTDVCFRLTRAGWRLAVARDSIVWHRETATVGKTSVFGDKMFNASSVQFFRKYSRFPLLSAWVGVGTRALKRLALGAPARAGGTVMGALRWRDTVSKTDRW